MINRGRRLSVVLWSGVLLLAGIVLPGMAAQFTQKELAYMPASTQLELFKQGIITPVDVLKAQIEEFKKTNKIVNAATYTHFDAAMKQAKESTKRYKDGTYRALEGITVGVKDEHYDKGWVVTQGSLVHKNDPPKDHADPIVKKLKAAGAVLSMQTTVPELYLSVAADTKAWGVTKNPWNPKFTPGGSSSGSGAALAAGYVTLATGSDMGGSIRVPSALNALYGYKPAAGEVHNEELTSYYSGSGPMARTFEDMVLMQNVISGADIYSPSVHKTDLLPLSYPSIKGKKIAYVGGMGIIEPTKDVQKAMEKAIKVFEEEGATVDRVKLDLGLKPEEISPKFRDMVLSGAMGAGMAKYAEHLDKMMPYAQSFVKQAATGDFGKDNLLKAEALVKDLYKRIVDAVFAKGYDVLILPTIASSHIGNQFDWTVGPDHVEDGKNYTNTIPGLYTIPFNMLNWMPVVNVPAGLSRKNMPIGMQIVGKAHDTETVFQFAYAYSKGGPKFYHGNLFPTLKEVD